MDIEVLNNLLSNVKELIDDENKKREDKGEAFNIFEITKKQSAEQHTHSAFIAELLNPNGSHKKGDLFLKYFLEIITQDIEDQNFGLYKKFKEFLKPNYLNTKVFVEKTILKAEKLGEVEGDTESSIESLSPEGGRLDILLKSNDNYISIENKIYASDQPNQIIRYCNFQKENNIVFYLTLLGEDPNLISKGKLKSRKHFYCISYKSHIIPWLDKCLGKIKEINASCILKGSISQYLILVKKLTNQLEKTIKMNEIIYRNLETTKEINKYYQGAIYTLRENFRNDVFLQLSELAIIKHHYQIEKQEKNNHWQIWIKPENLINPQFYFAIDSFSETNHENRKGKLYGGIRDGLGMNNIDIGINKNFNYSKMNIHWPIEFELYEEKLTNEQLVKLKQNPEEREEIINDIVMKMKIFIEDNQGKVVEANNLLT